ncbi:MAG: tetratricopeptide repeat protein [Planctomycetota bacterium]
MTKAIIIVAILLVIFIVPFIVLSNWGLDTIGKYGIDNNSPDWAWRAANIYSWSLREEKAIDAYTNFMERFPSDQRYRDAKYRRAICLAKVGPKDRAVAEFEQFAQWYPDDPNAEEAKRRASLTKYTR